MLLNYLRFSLRQMARNPFFTLINTAGLSIGFTAFYLLWPYSQNELKSDQFHKDYEQIARISRKIDLPQSELSGFALPFHNSGIARQFAREYPEIIAVTCIIPQQVFETYRQGFDKDVFVSVDVDGRNREYYREQNLAFADSNFFQFFSFPLELGEPDEILNQPNTAVVSSSHATKYFGKENPVNKTIYFNDSIPLTITGVFKDFPRNTHMRADVIISTAGIKQLNLTGWETNWWGYNYIKIAKGANFDVLEKKINAEKERIYGLCPRCPAGATTSAFIQPLNDLVFNNLIGSQNYKSEYLLIVLGVMAFVIPALAWINYLCLSIHMLHKRLSELSVRKAVGAGRRHFVAQFIVEAALFNTISLLISLTMVQLVKSPVESWLDFYTLPWSELPYRTIGIMVIIYLSGIAVTSAYPIVICINEKSFLAVRKKWSYSKSSWINLIITAQYSAAIVLLICVVCMYFQLNLVLSKPLGIDKDGILVIDCPPQQKGDFLSKLKYFTTKAATIEGIQGATISKNVLGDWTGYGIPLQVNKGEAEFGFDINGGVDENFLDVYGIKLLHGRNFRADMPADQNAILVSRNATAKLGFSAPEDALGARLILPWYDQDNVEVIGVYEDYEFRPLLMTYFQDKRGSFLSYRNYLMRDLYPSKISVRVDYSTFQPSLPALEKLFKEAFTRETFRWTFLDQNVQKHYSTEKIARNQIGVFTVIAIGIACLGLLGLVSNKIIEKTKDIGIRKILGAGLPQIARILLNTTTWQIMVAAVISVPIAYMLVSQYLENFSERITLQWWHFAFPLLALILIMLSTIATVVWQAARSNPVDALKHE